MTSSLYCPQSFEAGVVMSRVRSILAVLLGLLFLNLNNVLRAADVPVTFLLEKNQLQIQVGDKPFASYVYQDDAIPRPYVAHVRSPGGIQVTRNHPPVEGKDATDHAALHPGLWLAFGDLSGADFWRNKAAVK